MHQIIYKDRMLIDGEIVHEHQRAYLRNAKDFLFTNVAQKGLILISGREFTPVPVGDRQFRLLPGRFVIKKNGAWVVGDVPNETLPISVALDGVKYNVWLGYDTRQNGIGTVSVSGTAVTGTGTFFTREYVKNQFIAFETNPQVSYKIASVDSDTAITLVAGPAGAVTDEMHYLGASFYEDTPSGSDLVYIREFPYYTVTLESNLNAIYENMILIARIRTSADDLQVDLLQDYRFDNRFLRVPMGEEYRLTPAKPLNVQMTTGVVSRVAQKAWVAVTCGWEYESCAPSTLAVDISAAGFTFEADELVGQYFEDKNGNTFLIESNNTNGSSITLDGTPASGAWKIHPNAVEYEINVNMVTLPPRGDEAGSPPPRDMNRVDTGGVSFSPTAPEVLNDNYVLGAEYKFKMRSVNGPHAKSEWSDLAIGADGGISILAGQNGSIPAAPANLTLSYNDETENFTVVFDTVSTDTNGDPVDIDSYEVAWISSGAGHELPVFYGSDVNWIGNITGLRPVGGATSVSTTFGVNRWVKASDVEVPEGERPVKYVSAIARARATDGRPGAVSGMGTSQLTATMIVVAAPPESEIDPGGTVN